LFENIDKIDKPLANLTEMKRGKTQINKIRNDNGEITKNTKGVSRDYFEINIVVNWKI
jgi:hypothetical protein